jgi:hypothetical protein
MRWCRCFVISIGATLAFTVGCCAGQDMRDDSNPDAVPGIGTYNVRQEIQGLVKRLFSRVNSKDLNSLMECFWNSPDLVYVKDLEIVIGWYSLRGLLFRRYADPSRLGTIIAERIVVRDITADLASCVIWWTMQRATAGERGTTTIVCHKIGDDWRIISANTACF